MVRRSLLCCMASAALLLASPARADVAPGPDERDLPSEGIFTGLGDFPAYRFVLAAINFRSDPDLMKRVPPPVPLREGEPVSMSISYFQELRAIPVDAPEPVTDAWLAASNASSSGLVSRKARRVRATSSEKTTRSRFHIRQIQAGRISAEPLSVVTVMPDGSERPIVKLIPRALVVESFKAPPGWQLFVMPDPSWPRADPPPPVVPIAVGDVLPMTPGMRTLLAVEGAPGPDGSLAGKQYASLGQYLDPWSRAEVMPDSPAVARQRHLVELKVIPGKPLDYSIMDLYQDARGRAFWDEANEYPYSTGVRWGLWAGAAGGAAALVVGAWVLLRRRRARA